MKTILLCLGLGTLLFGGLVGTVRPRLAAPEPPPPPPPPAAVAEEVEEDPPIEAAVLSRIDLRRWRTEKKAPPKYYLYSRAMPPTKRPAPTSLD